MSYYPVPVSSPLWLRANTERWSADQLLAHFQIGMAPIDVFAIAHGLGAELHFVRNAEWDGAVDSKRDGSARIFVSVDTADVRQRFTVAHEVGHLLLHEPGRAHRDKFSSSGLDIAEIQANNFAAELLMPAWLVGAHVGPGINVAQFARAFGVSTQAMEFRLKKLGYHVG